MKYLPWICSLLLVLATACTADTLDPEPTTDCDQFTIVNAEQYTSAPDDFASIINATIVGDCLEIEFSASGCDGNSWEVLLVDSEAVAESLPVQRSLRLSLSNAELCQAVFMQTHSFDLTPIQVADANEVILNLRDWRGELRYTYE